MAHNEAAETAANVRAEMARAGYTSRGMAAEMLEKLDKKEALSSRTLSRRLAGDGAFRIDELSTIARFLGVPLSTLLPALTEVSA